MAKIRIKNTSTTAAANAGNEWFAPGQTREFDTINQDMVTELKRVGTTLVNVTASIAPGNTKNNEGSNPIVVSGQDAVSDVLFALDTNAYAANDVLAVATRIDAAFNQAGGTRLLQSVVVIDEDNQGQAIDLLFFSRSVAVGTINAVVTISDADARAFLGHVSIVAADYVALANSKVATKSTGGISLRADDGSTSLWVAAVLRSGTPTYTASGLRLKLGFL